MMLVIRMFDLRSFEILFRITSDLIIASINQYFNDVRCTVCVCVCVSLSIMMFDFCLFDRFTSRLLFHLECVYVNAFI